MLSSFQSPSLYTIKEDHIYTPMLKTGGGKMSNGKGIEIFAGHKFYYSAKHIFPSTGPALCMNLSEVAAMSSNDFKNFEVQSTRLLAKGGAEDAQARLAQFYLKGHGDLKPSPLHALKWIIRAADQEPSARAQMRHNRRKQVVPHKSR